jgi:flagellar hook protein FlgE
MGLSASMWTGVSGLLAHGEKMNVLGNNIANVNTVGFKASNMHFEDFFYQYASTTAQSNGQLGRGVSVAAIYGDFSQGSFETTNEATDLAIGGKGFFGVSPLGGDDMYYTRAGNFRFDKDGFLVDPHGYALQGWEIVRQPTQAATTTTQADDPENASSIRGVGVPQNIRLEGFTVDPSHTSRVTMVTNLDSVNGGDNSQSQTGNPYFALAENWNGLEDPPLGPTAYAYSSTIKVYDEGGAAHNLTVYYDQVSNAEGRNVWEFIVTMNPDEDKRIFDSGFRPSGTSGAGMLMIGTMSFNSAGQLEDMSAFTLPQNAASTELGEWRTTANSTSGYPLLAANFTGLDDASWVVDDNGDPIQPVLSNASGKLIEINFGLSTTPNATWEVSGAAAPAGYSPLNVGTARNALPGFGTNAQRSAIATTSYSGSSSTIFMSQDGYSFGFLQNVSVDGDGILSGRYSNGVSLELYQVTLYDFLNETGLNRAGGNLFTETRESGSAFPGPANANGLGKITSNALEQSNVDLAREFVQMITTQRGFSANGKVITTTDQMLSEVIMLKR